MEYTPEIEALKNAVSGLTDEDFAKWREEELGYLQKLEEQPEYDPWVVAYVEALEALKKAQYVLLLNYMTSS